MRKKCLWRSVGLLFCFAVWTVLVSFVDVAAIGPQGSTVGFAHINSWFHSVTGVNMWLYSVTDWMGLVPVAIGLGFGVLGLVQWVKRKNILNVDFSILVLGGFYIVTLAAYLIFEEVVINHRPILIEGFLEASYPSSTTLLTLCIMPTAAMQFDLRLKNRGARNCVILLITLFTVFVVIGRLISGVHWLTDIIGGAFLSGGIVSLYKFVCGFEKNVIF